MKIASFRTEILSTVILLALSCGPGGSSISGFARPLPQSFRLYGHLPARSIAAARWKGHLAPEAGMSMTFALPLRNQEELQFLLGRICDPLDPLYGHYISPQEFADRFGPTQADYDAVAGYAGSLGFTVTGTYPNRMFLDVSAPATAVEAGFNLRMQRYEAASGREFYAPDSEPEVPDFIASRIVGVIGLENANLRHSYSSFRPAEETAQALSHQIGTGPGGGLTPSDIAAAYNLTSVAANGSGQVLGLFELDGYNPNDVQSYLSYYGLPPVTLQNVLMDGVSGGARSGASEVTLDIELQIALAPGASRIIVYEGPNTDTGLLHTYNRIATDNLAKQISTSWGLSELLSSLVTMRAENSIFQQMAAQGQTIYAAAGDKGAYDSARGLSVDDPASQPFVVAAGGTRLFVNPGESYDHESTWNTNNTVSGGAGGGGISAVWSIPSWQQKVVSASSLSSTSMRNVPDVSLNADPQAGYSIYYRGRWYIFGGTSCVSPLWAAFAARVNQQRELNGMGPLGFANPAIYELGAGSEYDVDFHDIADGSTNLYYPAVPGYDDATGWGSFNGANLLADLAPGIRYYNALGQPYTNENVSYWQTADGQWWMGDKTGMITPIAVPPWLTGGN
jgi:subtilase family serine protease